MHIRAAPARLPRGGARGKSLPRPALRFVYPSKPSSEETFFSSPAPEPRAVKRRVRLEREKINIKGLWSLDVCWSDSWVFYPTLTRAVSCAEFRGLSKGPWSFFDNLAAERDVR